MSIKTAFQKLGTKIAMSAKANYPKWMVIGGTGAVIAAGVVACIKTHKELDAVTTAHKEMLTKVKELKAAHDEGKEVTVEGKPYTKETYQRHVFATYVNTAGKIVKIYALPVAIAILGCVLILKGHNTTEKRYVAAAAEGYAMSQAFKNYRERVADKFGKAVEEEIFVNGERRLVTEEEVDPETGEVKTKTTDKLYGGAPKECDIYSYIFDECNCPHSWSKHPGYNYSYLIDMQRYANDYLKSHGAITLYEVLKQLGYQDIPAETMSLGWMLNNPCVDNPEDVFIDFGICGLNGKYEDVGCFSGGTPDYVLNFNCQGDIQAAMKIKREKDRKRKEEIKSKGKNKPVAKAVIKK